MRSGLLWYDNSTNPLSHKLSTAQNRYRDKFGVFANRAFISPQDAQQDTTEFELARMKYRRAGFILETKSTILPNHIWLGVDEPARTMEQTHANYAA